MSAEGYTIRPAQTEDADTVTEMWTEMAKQHTAYNDVRWGWKDDAAANWRNHFIEFIPKENGIVLVAVDKDDSPVGFLMGGTNPTVPTMIVRCRGEISDMFVKSEFRSKGIGRMLMETATEEMKSRGAGYVLLLVACANKQAIDFYGSLGMQTVVNQMYKQL